MILLDANLLLYAINDSGAEHALARPWLDQALNAPARVGIPWPTLLGFWRISTNPRVFERPLTSRAAWQRIEQWLSRPNVWIPSAGERHVEIVAALAKAVNPCGNLVADLHLAALAMEHGLTLCSADGDFARFPGLTWLNPLAPKPRLSAARR